MLEGCVGAGEWRVKGGWGGEGCGSGGLVRCEGEWGLGWMGNGRWEWGGAAG